MKLKMFFLCAISVLSQGVQAISPIELEGKWCTAENANYTLGAYQQMPNPTTIAKLCIEYQLVRTSDAGGIGRYIVKRTMQKGQEYPIKRHPLEQFDEKEQQYSIESPGLFAFYTTKDGEIVLTDQSIGRDYVSVNGMVDAQMKMKHVVTYHPMNNQVQHASVSFLELDRENSKVDRRFEARWHALLKVLEKSRSQVR